jgi:isoleucyl-tRNA synthetase
MDWKSTLNLPDQDFTIPMKADLPNREPSIQARWEDMGIYHAIQAARSEDPAFVLHDGPPYTNSPIHIGTAANKMLKDFVVKSRSMMGFRSPYVPGFDNHGLPIEQAVLRAWAAEVSGDPAKLEALGFKERPSDAQLQNRLKIELKELRERCRAHAAHYIGVQTDQFKRLGIFGLWDKPYTTMSFAYEAEIVRVFKRLVEVGQVYRGLRPVLWSPTSRTALADTEIVYRDHVSKAIYVAFPLANSGGHHLEDYENLATVIWTTTPWTIPANVACAFHPERIYAIVRAGDRHFLLYEGLVEKTMETCGITDYEQVAEIIGEQLTGVTFKHPLFDRESVAVMAEYVTTEDGTGVVHTAPGHGRDDFYTGLRYNLPILCPVDDSGILTAEAGEFEGLFYKQCDTHVVERLREVGALLHVSDYTHSYPHAERDDKPVIFRTTEQWFVSIDGNDLRDQMLQQIERVTWHPTNSIARIRGMIQNRPDWCISRQRPWGVGIPVFFGAKSGEPVLDPAVIEIVAHLVETEGSDAWFLKSAADILPPGYKHPSTGETEFRKETDVFDVWFDSGATSLCVLEGRVEAQWREHWPADLYLEGSDQHRGWFNTSLIIGTAIHGEAPYREVLTHGFIVDQDGDKLSKRKGNAVGPVEACEQYGADVLRYWMASVDYTSDAPYGQEIMKVAGEHYRTVRNTLRFLLGNLKGFDAEAPVQILDLDRWVMEQTDLLVADVVDAYEAFDFNRAITGIHNFCANEISRFYADAVKDRMYCDLAEWNSRRSGQYACRYVLLALTKLIAPILCHTAEEVYERIPGLKRLASVHMETFAAPTEDRLEEIGGNDLQTRFAAMMSVRSGVFSRFEDWKKTGVEVKDSQAVHCTLTETADVITNLRTFADDLALYFKMSAVELKEGEPDVSFAVSTFAECERSRLRRADVAPIELDGQTYQLTARDARAIAELRSRA